MLSFALRAWYVSASIYSASLWAAFWVTGTIADTAHPLQVRSSSRTRALKLASHTKSSNRCGFAFDSGNCALHVGACGCDTRAQHLANAIH